MRYTSPRFYLSAVIGLLLSIACLSAHAQATSPARPAATARITQAVNDSSLVTLKGNVYPSANAKNDRGPVSPSLPMSDLTLVLSRSPEQQAAFDAFVSSQYDQNSPNYHHWLLPAEIGEQFGPAPADIATISNWLTGQGFTIAKVAKDGMSIRFSGTAAQVERTFHTQIDNLSVGGVPHIGNMTDPRIAAALAPVVVGVKALHNFLPRPLHKLGSKVELNKELGKWQRIVPAAPANSTTAVAKSLAASSPRPQFGINSGSGTSAQLEEDVTPYDFATIYNVLPLWNAGTNGSGQTIAIAGTSDIDLNDVSTFRSAFGLPAGPPPQQIDTNGLATQCTSTSPTAVCGIADLEENSIDVEWSGAVAPNAQIALVVTGQNAAGTVDAIYDSAEYVVDNLTAKILSVSYGECELGQGTAGNVAYYDLWQSAAAEGISVFVASGDAGSPACDDGLSGEIGNPYSAQFGLAVNGLASTPYDTAVGGTDFSWCKPTVDSSGNLQGCPTSSTLQGTPAYWSTTNNTTTGASALDYIPETPWNDTCMNPILAGYLESIAPLVGATTPTNAEGACNFVQNNWESIYTNDQVMLAPFVDTIGGGGGASNCVVNDGNTVSSCNSAMSNTGAAYGSIPLSSDGWQKPSWQAGVTGIPNDGVRDLPDVSFFAGDGTLSSAYLFCASAAGSCSYSSTSENTAQEAGGTSFGSPAMAGVMALINQKSGAAQGNPNSQLYRLGGEQTYSSCSAESVKTSGACYFNDVNQGTNAMACDLGASIGGAIYDEGWATGSTYPGIQSPNCKALNSGDQVGTLTTSSGATAYNAVTGFDLATGLGSLNVANVVNAWTSDAGTGTATMQVNLSATTISADTPLTVTVTVTASSPAGTPTGSVVVAGGGYSTSHALSGGTATITIPGNSLSPGSDKLTVTYGGDGNYASITQSVNLTVSAIAPTITVSAPTPANVANPLAVSVTVSGPAGAATPSGTVTLASGSYASAAVPLSSSGAATFNISANALAVGSATLTATYSGDSSYTAATGTFTVTIVNTPLTVPTVTVTPASASVNIGQILSVLVTVNGAVGTPTGTATLTAGSYTSPTIALRTDGSAIFTIPVNSFTAGPATIKAAYSGNAVYAVATGSANVTAVQSTYTLAATAPASVSIGGSTTSTVSVTSSTNYNGVITLTCAATSGPANAINPPTCAAGSSITMTDGTASGSATLTISTTSASAMLRTAPGNKGLGGQGWLGAGGAALAFVVFLGIPARRRSWRSLLGALVLLVTLASLSACGGGSGSSSGGGSGTGGTTLGAYTITVNAQGNDPASTTASTTFTVTVN